MAAGTIGSDLGPKKIKSVTVSVVYTSICHEVMGLDAMILVLGFFFLANYPILAYSSAYSKENRDVNIILK